VAWMLDLDGVVWLADQAVTGSAEAIARLRAAGHEVGFVTNNSFAPRREVEAKLARLGIDPGDHVVTSAMAAAGLVRGGETVLLCGGPGAREELEARGATVVEKGEADAVVVGFNPRFDYAILTAASAAVRAGARLIGTNDDATYPTPDGVIPGGGSLLAAVAYASSATPVVAGKPYPPMVDLVRARVGGEGVFVGDRPDTDGRFGVALGYRFALVLSGVTSARDLPVQPRPDLVADDLATLVTGELGD
jgi:HAD superfamily hydrolase (TIGR01450 family)